MEQLLHIHHTLRRQMSQALCLDVVRITRIERLLAVLPIKELHTIPPAPVECRVKSFVAWGQEFEVLSRAEELEGEYLSTMINLSLVAYQLCGLGSANPKSIRRAVFEVIVEGLVSHDPTGVLPNTHTDFGSGDSLRDTVFVLLPYVVECTGYKDRRVEI